MVKTRLGRLEGPKNSPEGPEMLMLDEKSAEINWPFFSRVAPPFTKKQFDLRCPGRVQNSSSDVHKHSELAQNFGPKLQSGRYFSSAAHATSASRHAQPVG